MWKIKEFSHTKNKNKNKLSMNIKKIFIFIPKFLSFHTHKYTTNLHTIPTHFRYNTPKYSHVTIDNTSQGYRDSTKGTTALWEIEPTLTEHSMGFNGVGWFWGSWISTCLMIRAFRPRHAREDQYARSGSKESFLWAMLGSGCSICGLTINKVSPDVIYLEQARVFGCCYNQSVWRFNY